MIWKVTNDFSLRSPRSRIWRHSNEGISLRTWKGMIVRCTFQLLLSDLSCVNQHSRVNTQPPLYLPGVARRKDVLRFACWSALITEKREIIKRCFNQSTALQHMLQCCTRHVRMCSYCAHHVHKSEIDATLSLMRLHLSRSLHIDQ